MDTNLAEPLLEDPPLTESPEAAERNLIDIQSSNNENSDENNNNSSNVPPTRTSQKMSSSFLAAVFMATVPMFLFGFNTGVLNAPESVIFPNHTTFQWSLAVSGFCVGGFFGANVSGSWADKFGRRYGLLVIFWLNLLAGVMHVLTPDMAILIIARILIGLAGGASTVLTPMYLSEISPKEIRGTIGTLTQLSCVVGILASILWGLPFNSESQWRLIFVPIPAMALLGIVVGPCVLLESPSWLLINHSVERGQEARDNLRRFRNLSGSDDDNEVIEMMVREEAPLSSQPLENTGDPDRFVDEPEGPQEQEPITTTTTTTTTGTEEPPRYSSFRDFVLDRKNRIPVISSILFPIAQQLSGINAVFYYSTALFSGIIPNPLTGTIIAFTVNAVATVVAVLLMDRIGRKTLLSVSAGGMFLCCIVMTLSLLGTLPGMLTVVGVMLYISFFELGLGCIPFFLATEMIESQFLGKIQSLSMSCNWFSNFCVGMLFPYMDRYLGPYSFVPFAAVLFLTVIYAMFVLPETRGKSPREVVAELDARRNRGHQPVPVVDTESPVEAGAEPETAFV